MFVNQSFPGFLETFNASNINDIDWVIIMLNQIDPELYTAVYGLESQCSKLTNTSCFELLMDPAMNAETLSKMEYEKKDAKTSIASLNLTAAFEATFTTLWNAKLPCFDTDGMTAMADGDRGILKKCSWKGLSVPCSGIFKTFPTDWGMCCSFNIKAADEIFTRSQFSNLVKKLQTENANTSFENSTLPDWYTDHKEPSSRPGRNLGLQVFLDAHSDVVESFSVSRDFEGFTGLVTDPGSFPLSNLKGFEVKPGHNNLVAVTAVQVDADDDLRDLKPETRKCLFPDETANLKLFKTYSQANCFLECNLKFAQRKQQLEQNLTYGCTPWYFPFSDDNFQMCDPYQTVEVWRKMQNDVPTDECDFCLPDCIRTIYTQSVTTQPIRRCDERNLYLTDLCVMDKTVKPQIWGKQVIDSFLRKKGKVPAYLQNVESSKRSIKVSYVLKHFFDDLPKEYDAYDKDIAVLNVFFDSTTVVKFKSQKRQTWIDYFANVGGALGLCIGLSVITIVELVWLCLRMSGFCKLQEEDPDEVRQIGEEVADEKSLKNKFVSCFQR